MAPKVFISYSWTSEAHKERVREWADRLLDNGVEVVLDQYDLKEGDDTYKFMERMVTDPGVSHVLMICDKVYAEKANKRTKGVGAESQIISPEIYKRTEQSKFIPVVCEFFDDDDDQACVPAFLESRKYVNFSSPEKVNENWESLIRLLFGRPALRKPPLGKPPGYLEEDDSTAMSLGPIRARFATLNQAVVKANRRLNLYRQDFLDACFEHADALRIRKDPGNEDMGQLVLDASRSFVPVRDAIVDWVLLEGSEPPDDFSDALIRALELLLVLRMRPEELTSFKHSWVEPQRLFAYETFLYIVAALLRLRVFHQLHEVFTENLQAPRGEEYGYQDFVRFDSFLTTADYLSQALAPEGKLLNSPSGEIVKRQAQRTDISLAQVIQADLLATLMCLVMPNTTWWPLTIYYSKFNRALPFFLAATRHRDFENLGIITGIQDADELRQRASEGYKRLGLDQVRGIYLGVRPWEALNMDKLDTLP